MLHRRWKFKFIFKRNGLYSHVHQETDTQANAECNNNNSSTEINIFHFFLKKTSEFQLEMHVTASEFYCIISLLRKYGNV